MKVSPNDAESSSRQTHVKTAPRMIYGDSSSHACALLDRNTIMRTMRGREQQRTCVRCLVSFHFESTCHHSPKVQSHNFTARPFWLERKKCDNGDVLLPCFLCGRPLCYSFWGGHRSVNFFFVRPFTAKDAEVSSNTFIYGLLVVQISG